MEMELTDAEIALLKGLGGAAPFRFDVPALTRLIALGLVEADENTRRLYITREGSAWLRRHIET